MISQYIFLTVLCLASLTEIEVTINGNEAATQAQCRIVAVVADEEFDLTEKGLLDILLKADSFQLRGSKFLKGFETEAIQMSKDSTDFLKVQIQTHVSRDSLELEIACVPREGYVRVYVTNLAGTRTYVMHDNSPVFAILAPVVRKAKKKRRRKQKD
jgi:hypothetical protein